MGRLLTAYCFGRASESERQQVEAHLLECHCCWHEARRLGAAVRVLDSDRSLIETVTPADIARAFGISGRLELSWGGHRWHVLIGSALYAALYAVGMLGEVAYEFDRYWPAGRWVALAIGGWMFISSLFALAVDWRLTLTGSRRGLLAAIGVFGAAILLAYAGACLFLPEVAVTRLNWPTYSAQTAYLKDIGYFVFILPLFLLLPFHFVLALQSEFRAGRHAAGLALLSGDKLSVPPREAFYLKPWLLAALIVVMIGVSLPLHHSLMDNAQPGPYKSLFANLILARLLIYYALAAECLAWYYRALNELKRECLAVLQARRSD